jgi:hypothetical protein
MRKPHVYLTTDPVNAAHAEGLAEANGIPLEVADPRDLPRLEREQAPVILDWDHLPPEYRTRLLNGTRVTVLAVHGYGIPDSVASFLPRRGVICSRRLDNELFAALARARAA